MTVVKAITLWQPWATLVIDGHKRFETRSWKTRHRGPLVIHTAARPVARAVLEKLDFHLASCGYGLNYEWPLGCALGIVSVTGMWPTKFLRETIPVTERAFGDFSTGRWGWGFAKKIEKFFVPIPMRGKQGLWNCRVEILGDSMSGRLNVLEIP